MNWCDVWTFIASIKYYQIKLVITSHPLLRQPWWVVQFAVRLAVLFLEVLNESYDESNLHHDVNNKSGKMAACYHFALSVSSVVGSCFVTNNTTSRCQQCLCFTMVDDDDTDRFNLSPSATTF
jgi:hypothetical protein